MESRETTPEAVEFRLSKIRTKILLQQPFWSMLFMMLKFNDASEKINTFSTDGTYVHYNREHVQSLEDEELKGALIVQVAYNFMRYMYRMDQREPETWKKACGAIVKHMLKQQGFTLPKGSEEDTGGVKVDDSTYAEQLYATLMAQPKQKGGKGGGSGGSGGQGQSNSNNDQDQDDDNSQQSNSPSNKNPKQDETKDPTGDFKKPDNSLKDKKKKDGKGQDNQNKDQQNQDQNNQPDPNQQPPDQNQNQNQDQQDQNGGGQGQDQDNADGQGGSGQDDEPQMTEHDWRIAIESAINVAKQAGNLPANMERLVEADKKRADTQDLITALHQFVQYTIMSDYSFRRPNKKYLPMIIPGMVKENAPPIAIGIDTSGSITHEMLKVFASILTDVLHEYRPEKLHVFYCDTRINKVDEFEPDDDIVRLTMEGGGGTLFQPVFDKIQEMDIEPACLIYLTDLYGPAPIEPDYPVLWVTTEVSSMAHPFGDLVRVDPYQFQEILQHTY